MLKSAVISPCGKYRYSLTRIWDLAPTRPACVFLMLNPSTANELMDDPTIRRCEGFARREGFGGFYVVNLMAWRATKPSDLPKDDCVAIGPDNAKSIQTIISDAGPNTKVITAWGGNGDKRPEMVNNYITSLTMRGIKLWCLGVTASGQPRHPLMLKRTTPLIEFKVKS